MESPRSGAHVEIREGLLTGRRFIPYVGHDGGGETSALSSSPMLSGCAVGAAVQRSTPGPQDHFALVTSQLLPQLTIDDLNLPGHRQRHVPPSALVHDLALPKPTSTGHQRQDPVDRSTSQSTAATSARSLTASTTAGLHLVGIAPVGGGGGHRQGSRGRLAASATALLVAAFLPLGGLAGANWSLKAASSPRVLPVRTGWARKASACSRAVAAAPFTGRDGASRQGVAVLRVSWKSPGG